MSEEQESSVLFSLKELMTIEEDRIKTEEEDRQKQEQDEQARREEEERRRREEEQARIAAEEQRRREEEQRAREEATRLEAIQRAELEKAQADAENKARLEAMTAQQQHERQLAALHQDKGKKKLRIGLIVGAVVVVLGGSTAGYFWYQSNQEAQARIAAQQAEQERLKEERERLKRAKEESDKKIAKLIDQLKSANSEADRARIQAELEAERAKATRTGGALRTVGKPGATPAPKKACKPGDPLCSDI